MPDIFDEVAEDLRADRTRALLRKYGLLVVAAAVAVVVGAAGWEAWKSHRASRMAEQANAYFASQALADGAQTGRALALPGFEKLIQTGDAGYRSLSRLRAAAIKAESGDLAGGVALWDQVSGDAEADPILRDYATLQSALHQIDTGDASAIQAKLQALTGPGSVWQPLAIEGEALLALRLSKTDPAQLGRARDLFKSLAADTTAPDGVRGRANGLLQRLGE